MQKYSWSWPDSLFLHLCIREGPWQRNPTLGFTEVKGTGLLWPQPGILFLLLIRSSRNPWKLNFTCLYVFYPSKRENVPGSQYSTGTWGCRGKPATAQPNHCSYQRLQGCVFPPKIPFSLIFLPSCGSSDNCTRVPQPSALQGPAQECFPLILVKMKGVWGWGWYNFYLQQQGRGMCWLMATTNSSGHESS